MNAKEIIEHGLLELYCLGETTPDENALIESMLQEDESLMKEFRAIQHSVEEFKDNHAKRPSSGLLRKIFDSIAQTESERSELPPLLSQETSASDWWNYLSKKKIHRPQNNEPLNMIEFFHTPAIVTYIVWADHGAIVEESHDDQIERLFMLQGSCKIEIDGSTQYYTEGDFIEIPAGTLHRAEATSVGSMILIGQRIAA